MTCRTQPGAACVVDNAGLCHHCGRPMNFDYWLAAISPEAYMNPDAYIDEWQNLVQQHEPVSPQHTHAVSTSSQRITA